MSGNFEPVRGYEDLYEVSQEGEVRNIATQQILKPTLSHNGVRVALYKNGSPKIFLVKLLVLKTFLRDPVGSELAVNLDGNEYNNRLDNLAYQTRSSVVRRNLQGSTKLSPSEEMEIKDSFSRHEENMSELAERFGVAVSTISRIIYGRGKR